MDIRSTLTEMCAAFNAHDLDRIMALFADDCVLEMPRGNKPWGSRFEGRQNVRAGLAGRFEGLPDVHYGGDEHFVDAAANTGMSKCHGHHETTFVWNWTQIILIIRAIANCLTLPDRPAARVLPPLANAR